MEHPDVIFVPYFFIETDDGRIRKDVIDYYLNIFYNVMGCSNLTDIKTIGRIDLMVKDKLRLPNTIGNFADTDKYEVTTMDAIKQLDLKDTIDSNYIENVILSKIEKPYKIVVYDKCLIVILNNGFFNLLLSNSEPVRKFITTDVITEYGNKFGKQELYDSPLFKHYVKNLSI